MKNFVKHTLAIAICAAALLSSCIKEENFKRDTVQLNVTLTRSSADSTQPGTGLEQGDRIDDVTLWAFSYTEVSNGFPVIADDAKAVGYRYVSGITNTYGSIGIHVPLPTCDNTANYIIVAVINRSAFGSDFSLGQTSDWKTIREANFTADGAFWSVHPQSKDPELMPVSNWAAFTINSGNVHEQNTDGTWKCYNLQLPVYRAVAKSQLYMAKTSENFTLVVKEAKVVANSGYSDGKVLTYTSKNDTTKSEVKGLPSASDSDWWWTDPTTANSVSYAMRNTAVENSPSTWKEFTVTQTGSAESPQNNTFQWVGSTFLLENDNEAPYGTTGAHEEAQGDGYNLYVKYTVDGQEYEVYTPLGKVVRNHDYQVKATVDAGGEMTLTVIVNEWSVEDRVDLDYQNTVTVSQNDRLQWDQVIADADGDGNVDTAVNANKMVESGVLYFPSTTGQEAVCHFSLKSPVDGEWQAELVHVSGETGHFVFSDATIKVKAEDGNTESELSGITGEGTSLLRGPISNGVITLKIQTAKSNAAASGGMAGREPCRVRLEITAKKTWGGAERTYRVYDLTGLYKVVNGQNVDVNYELEQIPTL